MNVDERIAKLEALLARVRSRSKEPRGTAARSGESAATAAPTASSASTANGMATASPPAPAVSPSPFFAPAARPVVPRPSPVLAPPIHEVEPGEERTIEENVPVAILPIRPPEPSHVRPIEPPPMEVIELDLEPDPSIPPPPMEVPPPEASQEELLESRSRLVSAPPVALEEDESRTVLSGAVSDPTIEVGEPAELAAAELEAIEEPAPSSSRRPISVEEKLKQLEEDDGSVHAPPPESGRLPAAPILNLDEPDVSGVHRSEEVSAAVAAASLASEATEASFAPEVTRAAPPDSREVATFVGRPPEPRPTTFGDLLDLTLTL